MMAFQLNMNDSLDAAGGRQNNVGSVLFFVDHNDVMNGECGMLSTETTEFVSLSFDI